jgi:putative membrane protein
MPVVTDARALVRQKRKKEQGTMYWHFGAGWGLGWMVLIWFLPLALLAAIFMALIGPRRRGEEPGSATRQDSPEAILKRRYAKGEINREEYQRMLEDLRR